MRNVLQLLALVLSSLLTAQAAILVGANGSGVISFATLPSAVDWSTRSVSGTELTFTSAAALEAAVQTNSASLINSPVQDGLGSVPPGQNSLASWSGGGTGALWTRPAANGATLLMAALVNNTGKDQDILGISYTLGQSGTSPAEQLPAHEVFYSLSGLPGTWIHIAALSRGTAGGKNQFIALAGVWASGATLFVLWADDNTPGGVDRGYSIDDVSFSGRPPPALEVIPDFITDVLHPVFFRVQASNAVPNARLIFLLEPGAPATARLHATNGLFIWKPGRADAATTNLFSVRVADAIAAEISTTQSFTVVVRDYVELSVGSVVMAAGGRTNVTIEFVSSTPLTNLSCVVLLPMERLTNLVVENLAPALATVSLDASQPGQATLIFNALPGQLLLGTQSLARLHFTADSEQRSAFIPLKIGVVAFGQFLPGLQAGVLRNDGRAVVVNREPLLEASGTNGARVVTLYGRTGTNYTIEATANVPGPWLPWQSATLEKLAQTFAANDSGENPLIFYRAIEGSSMLEGAPAATSGAIKAAKKLQKRKVAAALKRWKKLHGKTALPGPTRVLP